MGAIIFKEADLEMGSEERKYKLKESIPLEHSTGQRPYKYYERICELGSGSMGAVMKVNKKQEYVRAKVNSPSGDGYYNMFSFFYLESIFAMFDFQTLYDPTCEKSISKKQTSFAMKRILLDKVSSEYIDEMRNEISILRGLDHPNIVKLYEIYDVDSQIYIVMELCSGGNLWGRSPYSEKDATKIIRQLVSAVEYMHEEGICHRDIKMENILFQNKSQHAEIKLIDFGLSKKCKRDEQMTSRVGSFCTMAPQVLKGVYNSQADMWAVGVIAYTMLSNEKPFEAPTKEGIVARILRCDFDFEESIWNTISEDAKTFISDLIEVDPEKRLTAKQANQSTWLQNEDSPEILNKELVDKFNEAIVYQSESSLMKKIGLLIIAHHSSSEEILTLRKAFQNYDNDNDGIITFEDFHSAMEKFGFEEKEIKYFFEKLDVNGNGLVYYTEFLAAALETLGRVEEDRLVDAFNRINVDGTGFISKENMKDMLGLDYDPEVVEKTIKELDNDEKGKVSFEEFKKLYEDSRNHVWKDCKHIV